jgi:hypothetical protein
MRRNPNSAQNRDFAQKGSSANYFANSNKVKTLSRLFSLKFTVIPGFQVTVGPFGLISVETKHTRTSNASVSPGPYMVSVTVTLHDLMSPDLF